MDSLHAGIRTSKTVNGVVYNYYYDGSQLVRMTYGDNVLDFSYDINGVPVAMRHGYASHNNYVVYYYITNLQGDVVRLVDIYGNTAAYYEYDPYGNAIYAGGSHANINPLRYRGYVYDSDTGFYYLQSRYYDPKVSRFLNADDYASTGQGILGHNMFAYCGNNPTNFVDPCGNAAIWYYLFQDFMFGLLHRLVELHILATHAHVGELEAEHSVDTGRADIVNMSTGDVWEIKHGRNESYLTVRVIQATEQAKKYLGHGGIRQLGPAETFNGAFVVNCKNVSYEVSYKTPSQGVIIYTVKTLGTYEPSPYHAYEPKRETANIVPYDARPATVYEVACLMMMMCIIPEDAIGMSDMRVFTKD